MAGVFGPLVSAQWLAGRLGEDALVVVDCRWTLDGGPGRAAYDTGHVPSAVFVDLDTDLSAPPSAGQGRHPLPTPDAFAAAMRRCGIGDETRVVAYDDAGGVIAARLWWMLDVTGRAAAVLDGGLAAWPGPLETDTPSPVPGDFTARPWPGDRHITKADLAASLGTGPVVLDARSPDRYAHGGAVDPRPGHVPTARNAPAGANLSAGRFRAPAELAAHYASIGVDGDAEVVAYCGSGVTACADLLAMRLAGLPDGRLFVGSWSAWGADESLPAEVGTGGAGGGDGAA